MGRIKVVAANKSYYGLVCYDHSSYSVNGTADDVAMQLREHAAMKLFLFVEAN